MNDNSYKVIEIDINEILPNRFQPRIQFDEEEILELSDSIKEHGVIQPLVVRTIGDKYEIIAGERRYKASVLAGKETVPVIIKNLNDKDSAEIALIENIQRKNLTPIEEALSYKKILDMGYITQENLALKLGKSQSAVANKIRLLNLSDEVQEALLDNKISERHARSLLRIKMVEDQNSMLNKIINERLTVRKTDEEIDKLLNSIKIEEEVKEEKGDKNMNNEVNQIPNVVTQQPSSTFDIFGGTQSLVPEVQNVTAAQPVAMPSVPLMEAVSSAPVAPAMPQIGGIQFDAQGNVIAAPMSTPVLEVPIVPLTAPIIESESTPDSYSNPQVSLAGENVTLAQPLMSQESSTINEDIKIEPIIVTDYSKQYDPVMPNTTLELNNQVDFKEVISAIRECAEKIEKYGYRIDVEEYDLSSLYQVVFKIEK